MNSTGSNIYSQLEILTLSTRQRRKIHEARGVFEAPNWSRDGCFLIINADGLLYRLSVTGDDIEPIDTGFANRCNNDHGISPDGTRIVISHHDADSDDGSVIYTIPIEGGKPQRVTDQWPSFWHGWSPDGTTLAYVARRSSHQEFKIYTVPTAGGPETQLTFGPGKDDGPDYAADGRSIYYNSYRSGRMQIWRMDTDGGNPVQVVQSQHSDWFPHPSPDGKKLVFLRYLEDLGQRHPFGQDVKLMLLDLESDALSDLTDVFFGGQGTINVPSWSPDSAQLAFVSYRQEP